MNRIRVGHKLFHHRMNIKTTVMPAALFIAALALGTTALAQVRPATNGAPAFRPELLYHPRGNFTNQTARPLRYWPVGTDFVITNGAEFFNRPLYGLNSSFRIDGGDRPEFSLYLPGRGGNLRFGIKTSAGVKWLNDARQIVTRYRPGSLLYEIRDPLLGDGELDLAVLPLAATKGFIVRAERRGAAPADLIWAYGGANGLRGSRDGDIGCEHQPVSEFFRLQPEQCRDDSFSIGTNTFTLRNKKTTIAGVMPPGATLSVADAAQWESPAALLASAAGSAPLPVVVGQVAVPPGQPVYLAWQQLSREGGEELPVYREVSKNHSGESATNDKPVAVYQASDLPGVFAGAEEYRRTIAERVVIETPDPFINAAAAALNIAADAVWDGKQQSFMHGAVAWRTRLLGWRGQYAGDELGWHERTAAHFAGFAKQQNTSPVPETIPPADEQFNLARSEAAIHSNGDMSKNHYDMNLVAVDAFFRHLLWTGDTNYARQMWPVIERHLAWERRLFRREFGPDHLPLYEAYAAIWASDDLNYNGGGTAHASAYNYFANKMAARVAKILGEDPAIYEREAGLILRGMNNISGWRTREILPSARICSVCNSCIRTPGCGRFITRLIPKCRRRRRPGRCRAGLIRNSRTSRFAAPTCRRKSLHAAGNELDAVSMVAQQRRHGRGRAHIARLLAGEPAGNGVSLFKGWLLDSMFLGLCPGNLGGMTPLRHGARRGATRFRRCHRHQFARPGRGTFRRRAGRAGGRIENLSRLSGEMGSRRHPASGFQFCLPPRRFDGNFFHRTKISQADGVAFADPRVA